MTPTDPLAAVVHADPYPYYAQLASGSLHYHAALGLWIAASAADVEAVLRHPACRVRPVPEPVPNALHGSASGSLFGHLVRMNDGAFHTALKAVLIDVLEASDALDRHAECAAQRLDRSAVDYLFAMPVYSIAGLLGVPDEQQAGVFDAVAALVAGLSPLASAGQRATGAEATIRLRTLFGDLLSMERDEIRGGLLGRLVLAAEKAQLDPQAALDNAIGLLWQTHDASAGLIGNSLVQLARRPALRHQLLDNPDLLPGLIAEVARYDAPVQNTRRFLSEDAVIADVALPAGACVLLLLAAANRDAAANPEPERFDIARPNRRSWTFGSGAHACPGSRMAQRIAASAVAHCLDLAEPIWQRLAQPSYRVSLNARIPQFLIGTAQCSP